MCNEHSLHMDQDVTPSWKSWAEAQRRDFYFLFPPPKLCPTKASSKRLGNTEGYFWRELTDRIPSNVPCSSSPWYLSIGLSPTRRRVQSWGRAQLQEGIHQHAQSTVLAWDLLQEFPASPASSPSLRLHSWQLRGKTLKSWASKASFTSVSISLVSWAHF